MNIVIVVSSPPDRQAFRSDDPRSAAILAEKSLWPRLKCGRKVQVTVQASDPAIEASLTAYFRDLIRTESEFTTTYNSPRSASA